MTPEEQEKINKLPLNNLFLAAVEKSPFDALCTILRVDGMSDPGWDPLEESQATIEHYAALAKAETTSKRRKMRLGVLIYCHITEMGASYEVVSNLLRILQGKSYQLDPFQDLEKEFKDGTRIPPSLSQKLKRIRKQAEGIGSPEIYAAFDTVVVRDLRNAFYHSDYSITENEFRLTRGFGKSIPWDDVKQIIEKGLDHYARFTAMHKSALASLRTAPQFHKVGDWRVLELLRSADGELYGFSVHFSNDSKATFARTTKGIIAENLVLQDNDVDLYYGDLDALRDEFRVNGAPFKEDTPPPS